jgi:DNA replication protein DnaC
METFKLKREGAIKHLELGTSVIITGEPGVGKTTIVRKPRMVSAAQIAMEYQAHGLEAVQALINNQVQFQGMTVVIDDLGIEEDVKHFGNGLDPIAYIVQRIYDINQVAEQKIRLLITTNLTKQNLTDRYGVRVIERLWEMCDRIVLEDTNLRA